MYTANSMLHVQYAPGQQLAPCALCTPPTAGSMCSAYTANRVLHVHYVHCQQHASCAVCSLPTARFMCSMCTANSTLHVQYVHCQQHAPCAVCTLPTARYNACVLHQRTTFLSSQASNLARRGATLSLARRAMEPGHLLHSVLTRPLGAVARRLKSRHPFVPAAQHLISFSDNNNIRAMQWADHQWNAEWADNPTRPPHFNSRYRYTPPGLTLPRRAWVQLNRFRTGVGLFRSCLYKWSMASSAACECGADKQTIDHVVLPCPIHRPPHGLHGLTVLDDETTEWLLDTCPDI